MAEELPPISLVFEVDDRGRIKVDRIKNEVASLRPALDAASRAKERFRRQLELTIRPIRILDRSMFSLNRALGVFGASLSLYGVSQLAKSVLGTGNAMDQFRLRLEAATGSVFEANEIFEDSSKFASKVAYSYNDLISQAVIFRTTIAKTPYEVRADLALAADVATQFGLTLEQSSQQLIRAFSAGAGSADLFRERGVLAALGFQAGVTYSAEETRKKFIEEWTAADSFFRGSVYKMAGTLEGQTSMMADQWTRLKAIINDAGLYDLAVVALADTVDGLRGWIDANEELIKQDLPRYLDKTLNIARGIGEAGEFVADNWKLFAGIVTVLNPGLGVMALKWTVLGGSIALATEALAAVGEDHLILQDTVVGSVAEMERAWASLVSGFALMKEQIRHIAEVGSGGFVSAASTVGGLLTLQPTEGFERGMRFQEEQYTEHLRRVESILDAHNRRLREIDASETLALAGIEEERALTRIASLDSYSERLEKLRQQQKDIEQFDPKKLLGTALGAAAGSGSGSGYDIDSIESINKALERSNDLLRQFESSFRNDALARLGGGAAGKRFSELFALNTDAIGFLTGDSALGREKQRLESQIKQHEGALAKMATNESKYAEQILKIREQLAGDQEALANTTARFQLQLASQVFAGLGQGLEQYMEISGDKRRELVLLTKAAGIAQATIDTFTAANAAMAAIPPPFGQVAAATTVALGLANVAAIAATPVSFHDGGLVARRQDASTDFKPDEVPAVLQTGEFVVSRLGLATLEAANRGEAPARAEQSPVVPVVIMDGDELAATMQTNSRVRRAIIEVVNGQ